jgi:hypothetical protein
VLLLPSSWSLQIYSNRSSDSGLNLGKERYLVVTLLWIVRMYGLSKNPPRITPQ